MLEPTHEQRSRLKDIQGSLTLVQFLSVKDQAAFDRYRAAFKNAVGGAGGRRTHDVRIDQYLAGGEMHFHAITVDQFPSGEAALKAFDALSAERGAALTDVYALAVRPIARLPRIVKALGFLSPVFSRILGTTSEKEMNRFAELANPETGPIPETIAVLKMYDQTPPFYMMNLNKYYPKAQYGNGDNVTGEQAYNRYASRIAPYLISVRGYPDLMTKVIGLFVGDDSNPLHDDWDDFAMMYYPSRGNFLNMMTNTPKKGAHHRDAGLQRAVLMPSTAWEEV
jgi:hypothetical protein